MLVQRTFASAATANPFCSGRVLGARTRLHFRSGNGDVFDDVRRAVLRVTGVVVDADYGANAAFRAGLERLGLAYGVAIRGEATCTVADGPGPLSAIALADSAPDDAWETVTWGTGTAGPLTAEFCALRVRPTAGRGDRWLLCERSAPDVRKYYLVHLPATTPLVELVALARSRWPIEQQYPRAQGRPRPRSLRRPHLSGLDPSRRAHGRRVHLPADRTGTRHRRPPAHAARRAWLGPRDHGPALRAPQPATSSTCSTDSFRRHAPLRR